MAINKNKVNDNALKYIQKGQIKKAIKEYEKILAEEPSDVRTLLKKGDLLVRVGEKDEAVETYLKVASTYSQQGFHLKAVAVFKQILKIDDKRLDVNLKLADEYQNLGIVGDAITHLQSVVVQFETQGKIKESLEILQRIVELDPENVASRIKLAELFSREGLTEDAVREFGRAAEYLKTANRIEDFIKVAERLIFHDSKDLKLVKELANIYLQRGDTKRALVKLQICFKEEPQDLETLTMLGLAFQELGQPQKTVSVYKEMAKIHQDRGNTEEMHQVYRRILELCPDDPDAYQALHGAGRPTPPQDLEDVTVEHRVSEATPEPDFALPDDPDEVVMEEEVSFEEAPIIEADQEEVEIVAVPEESAPAPGPEPPKQDSGDLDAETIERMLTETSVYIKYGLQRKASDHIDRILESDPGNIAAHQKRKELYLSLRRNDDAILELWNTIQLATRLGKNNELKGLVSEMLALSPGHAEASELARRLGVQIKPVDLIEIESDDGIEIGSELGDEEVIVVEEETTGTPLSPKAAVEEEFPIVVDSPLTEEEDLDQSTVLVDVTEDLLSLKERPPSRAAVQARAAPELSAELPVEVSIDTPEDGQELILEDESPAEGEPELIEFDVDEPFFQDGAASTKKTKKQAPARRGSAGVECDVVVDEDTEEEMLLPEEPAAARAPDGDPGVQFIEEEAPFGGEVELEAAGASADLDDTSTETRSDPGDADFLEEETPPPPAAPSAQKAEAGRIAPVEVAEEPEEMLPEPGLDETVTRQGVVAEEEEDSEDISDGLEEVDFYLQQELVEEAEEALVSLQQEHPEHPEVLARLEKINRLKSGAPSVPAVCNQEASGEFDIAAEIASEMGDEEESSAPLSDEFQYSVDDVFSAFKKGVEKVVDRADSATHFDLGIAYKEMGLVEDAISEFTIAAQDPARKVSSLTMIGLCFIEKGQFSEAINRFRDALHGPSISENEATGLYYEMGHTYELLQNAQEALFFYRKVLKRDAGFRDVAARLKTLDKGGDAPPAPRPEAKAAEPEEGDAEEEATGPKKEKKTANKISYM